ncbi:hypothetical protein EJ05DRAFT_503465 [Pseudovirgaria hyperparasitica]|uniref:Mediator of RNA polymerase II transcription subunit 8 n=1 Tax=Pseudovirgaria hyperparasitica TaxID=470096 RepID=A0A6A6W0Q6_9PEZI|nr:uncharacterized protein EJ05DRAFT_503465 [Pseudovirgaria hyperparasitica]KAF2755157.1 hypothetical protein EJ05DRAFT_503465 [Pseudovirgaria hyperparasitica]
MPALNMEQQHAPDEVRVLEQLRAQLHTLCGASHTMIMKLQYGTDQDSLPPWPVVQSSINDIARNLQTIQTIMASSVRSKNADSNESKESNIDFLQSAHVHTLPNFPASAQRDLLYTMLRKKLDNPVEDWFSDITNTTNSVSDENLDNVQLRELWNWAPVKSNKIARTQLGLIGVDESEDEGETEDENGDEDEDHFEDSLEDGKVTEAKEDKMQGVQTEDRRGSDMLQEQQQRRASIAEHEPGIHARKMMDLIQILPFSLTGTLGSAPSMPTLSRK